MNLAVVDENAYWDRRDLTSEEEFGPSALQRVQEQFQTHGFLFPFVV